MARTLMILSHPKIENSIGNRIISTGVSKETNLEIRHLDELYPNFKIDVKAEQEALLNSDTIILQYPLFWYGFPAILKEWVDQVFQYGFAFGNNSYQLENKKIVASFTMGSPNKEYPQEVIDKITYPVLGLANYCKMNYVGEVYSNDINDYSPGAKEKAVDLSKRHTAELIKLIKE